MNSKDYYGQAIELCKAGRNFINLLQKHHKSELLYYKKTGVIEKVVILTAGNNSCEHCQKLDHKILTIAEALETMPLPVKHCTADVFGTGKGFCRCVYAPEVTN